MTNDRDQLRDELLAITAARQELTPVHDKELIEHFLDSLNAEIDRRIDERVAARVAAGPQKRGPADAVPVVPIALVFAIPLTAIAAAAAGLAGVIVAWAAIAAIVYFATRG
jgi:hypothetical protein